MAKKRCFTKSVLLCFKSILSSFKYGTQIYVTIEDFPTSEVFHSRATSPKLHYLKFKKRLFKKQHYAPQWTKTSSPWRLPVDKKHPLLWRPQWTKNLLTSSSSSSSSQTPTKIPFIYYLSFILFE